MAGLDAKNLKLSIGSGDVVLQRLRLKKTALEDLQLPIEVTEGALFFFKRENAAKR